MNAVRAWLALVILLGGLAAFAWRLVGDRDPLGAIGWLSVAILLGELIRPSADAVDRATARREDARGRPHDT